MNEDALPEVIKLRVKLGLHEFEAEGSESSVAAHFQTWQRLIAAPAAAGPAPATSAALEIFTVDSPRKLITLRVNPTGKTQAADAALLILYGYHDSFGENGRAVDVARLKTALAASGYPNARTDRILAPHLSAHLVAKGGRRRGLTYQLTTSGYQKAAELARTLHASEPSRP